MEVTPNKSKTLKFYACLIENIELLVKKSKHYKILDDKEVLRTNKKTIMFKLDRNDDEYLCFRLGVAKDYWKRYALRDIETQEIKENPKKLQESEEIDYYFLIDKKTGVILRSADHQFNNENICKTICQYFDISGIFVKSWLDGKQINDYKATKMQLTLDGTDNMFAKNLYSSELTHFDFLDLTETDFGELRLELIDIKNKHRSDFKKIYDRHKNFIKKITVTYIDDKYRSYTEDFVEKIFNKSIIINVEIDDDGLPEINLVYQKLFDEMYIINNEESVQ
ncbi:MAG: hypothetical protein FD141_374 [Fusobacteria bacterium]|nr:MAG: hypothetical protein FD141_374 [Fusobacteriota bacterium]KAF0228961.1 MAG: hypothetical protein FD182_1217 [Fusobacteriota bacterium]